MNMKKFFTKKTARKKGYILLLSVLISSIILAMSLGIFTISIKEVVLASFLKDSARAFQAADRAVECTLYWDRSYPQNGIAQSIFSTSTSYVPPSNINNAVCDGQQLTSSGWTVTNTSATGTTQFLLNFVDGSCATVEVIKDGLSTMVTSNGYNSCDASNPRRTQRTIEVESNT